jgi:POT family proton-dependent oligopeptide transporter
MFKKHPRGLAVLFFTEMWERFGFYILMAILTLYMEKEFGWNDSTKGDYYGWFLGAVYFIPLLGGYLGDKILGQLSTVKVGAFIMTVGYVLLALSNKNHVALFVAGLFMVAFGTGIFKVNMSVLVGNLYKESVAQRDAGFNIYYMGVNIGAAVAPLAATLFFNLYESYNVSFWAASIGMVVSLGVFQFGKDKLILSGSKTGSHGQTVKVSETEMNKTEFKQRVVTLIILFTIVVFFWIGFYQNGFALTLFAERSTVVLSWLRPETYQFFNPFFILLLTPILLSIFARLNAKGKEPQTPIKILIGMLVMGCAMAVMIPASLLGGNTDANNMTPMWLVSTYFVVTLAEIMISPMGQSFVSKVAPPKIQGLMMGGWFAATALGSYGSGFMGKFYSNFQHHEYFLILTGLLAFSVVLVLVSLKKLKRFS